MLELIYSSNAKNAMKDVKEAIKKAPNTAEAYLYSLAHKYAKKAYQEASKLVQAAKLEQPKAKRPKVESEAKTLEDAVFENFKKLLSHVSLHKPLSYGAYAFKVFVVARFFCS